MIFIACTLLPYMGYEWPEGLNGLGGYIVTGDDLLQRVKKKILSLLIRLDFGQDEW